MKGLITICPECQVKTELREITVEFERKGIRATMSGIPAMVCPHCGEEYIPGEIGGDVIDVVSRAIDYLEALLKRSEVRRKELLPDQPTPSPKRLELALASAKIGMIRSQAPTRCSPMPGSKGPTLPWTG